jgi:hypothetical protein
MSLPKLYLEKFHMINELNSNQKYTGFVSIVGEVEQCQAGVLTLLFPKGKRIQVEKCETQTINKKDKIEVFANSKDGVYTFLSYTLLSSTFDIDTYQEFITIASKSASVLIY